MKHLYALLFLRECQLYLNFQTVVAEELYATITRNLLLSHIFKTQTIQNSILRNFYFDIFLVFVGAATGRVREGERGQGQGLLPLHEDQAWKYQVEEFQSYIMERIFELFSVSFILSILSRSLLIYLEVFKFGNKIDMRKIRF